MSGVAELLKSVAAVLWVVVAIVAVVMLRSVLLVRRGPLAKLDLGPSGVKLEFAEEKLDEAIDASPGHSDRRVGNVARRSVLDRLQRNQELLGRARLLWVDDHPENNRPIVELLRRFGASVDTPTSNPDALAHLRSNRYDVVLSDVGRDDEGAGSQLKGVELAERVHDQWGIRVILFTASFDPVAVPGVSDAERLTLVGRLRKSTFAITTGVDEVVHYILDVLER